jgi:peptide/nickel transport system permease protein
MGAVAVPRWSVRRRAKRGLPWSLTVGLVIVAALVVVALVNRFFIGNPNSLHLLSALQGPSLAHPFGTDNFGRDVLERVLASTGTDLMIGFLCVIPALCIGTTVGIVAGYFGGWGDALLMRIVDVMVAFPFLVLVIAIVAALGAGITNMFIAVAAVGWVSYARLARSETQVIRQHDYVAAARVLGFSRRRILARHVLPNAIVQPLIYSTSDFIGYIILGSALGFLGLGVQPPHAEWGAMIADGQNYLTQAPWITIAPGLAIVFVGTAFVLLGDGLAVVLRPEVRQ